MVEEEVMTQDRRSWSQQDMAELTELSGKLPSKYLAMRLNRTESATRVRAWELGLSVRSKEARDAATPTAPEMQALPDVKQSLHPPPSNAHWLSIVQAR